MGFFLALETLSSDAKPIRLCHQFDLQIRHRIHPERLARKTGLKRLAIQVEDHALEFEPFHETSREGESGAGRVKVWDHGTYEVETWTADRIAFNLHGSWVSGRFSLVRFKESEPLSWFFTKRDRGRSEMAGFVGFASRMA
jgi:DNA ligase D-like protein (predicted 3'-phosphoesterase)